MKIYNEDKTKQLQEQDCDLTKGYFIEENEVIHHKAVKGKAEKGHYEVIKEYPNGGKDVEYIIDQAYVESKAAYDETIPVKRYVEYTKEEIKLHETTERVTRLREQLAATDYEAIKYAEGWFTEEEYAPIKAERESLRQQIRLLIDTDNSEK